MIMSPSEFAEKYMNVKLYNYHKILLDNYKPKTTYYYIARHNNKRLLDYYNLCIHCSKMRDDEFVIFITPKGDVRMNKEELANYLLLNYWK